MTTHKQVPIAHGEQEAEVDAGVADLILALWRAGIDTMLSCEDNGGRVWVEFPTAANAERFLDIAAAEYDEGMESLTTASSASTNRTTGRSSASSARGTTSASRWMWALPSTTRTAT